MHYPPLCFTFAFLATLSARPCYPAPLSTSITPSGPPSALFDASSKAVVGSGVSGSPGLAESQAQPVAQTPTPSKGTTSLGVLTVASTAISPSPTQAPTTTVQMVAPTTSQTQTTKVNSPAPTSQTATPTTVHTSVQNTGQTPGASSSATPVTTLPPPPPSTASTAQLMTTSPSTQTTTTLPQTQSTTTFPATQSTSKLTTTFPATQSTSNAVKTNPTTVPLVASTPGPLAAESTGASTAVAATTFGARTNNVTPQGSIITTTLEMITNKAIKTEAIINKGTSTIIGETKAGSNGGPVGHNITNPSGKEMAPTTPPIEHTNSEYRAVKNTAPPDQSPGSTPPPGGDVAQVMQGTTPLSSFMHSIVALVGVGVLVAVVVLGPLLVVLVVIVLLVVRCRARRQERRREQLGVHVHADGHQERSANGRQGDSDGDGGERAQEHIALLDLPEQHEVLDAHDTVPAKKTGADANENANAIAGHKKGNGAKKVNDSFDSPEAPLTKHEGQVDEIHENPEEKGAQPRAPDEICMHDAGVKT